MKLFIDLPDNYAKTLANWASVSRTLKGAAQAIESGDEAWGFYKELLDLEPALNALHQATRSAIWDVQKRGNRAKEEQNKP